MTRVFSRFVVAGVLLSTVYWGSEYASRLCTVIAIVLLYFGHEITAAILRGKGIIE